LSRRPLFASCGSAERHSGVAVPCGVGAELAHQMRLAAGETEALAEVEAFCPIRKCERALVRMIKVGIVIPHFCLL
jgi:hypothetical protein